MLARRMLVFLLPVLTAVGILEGALARLGESWPIALVVRAEDPSTPSLYGRRYFSQQFGTYKQQTIARRAPAILVLGSSRVQQLRAADFAPFAAETYNGGGMVQHLGDLAQIVAALERADLPRPRAVLIGIDPWWLQQDGRPIPTGWSATNDPHDNVLRPTAHRRVARQLLRHPRLLTRMLRVGVGGPSPFFSRSTIGAAALEGQGFREDGSFQYDPQMLIDYAADPRFRDREQPPVIDRIRQASHQFAPTPGDRVAKLDPARLDVLVSLLERLVTLGIEVDSFLPPFSNQATTALEASPVHAAWWHRYRTAVPARLEAAGIPVLPASAPRDHGLDDRFMIDGFHPSEVFSAHLLRDLSARARGDRLLGRLDRATIEHRLTDAATPLAFALPPGVVTGPSARPGPPTSCPWATPRLGALPATRYDHTIRESKQ